MTYGLSEQRFTSYEDTKKWVNSWIASKDESFFRLGIRMLPERWEKWRLAMDNTLNEQLVTTFLKQSRNFTMKFLSLNHLVHATK